MSSQWTFMTQRCADHETKVGEGYHKFVLIEGGETFAKGRIKEIAPGVDFNFGSTFNSLLINSTSSPQEWLRQITCEGWCKRLGKPSPWRVYMYYKDGSVEIAEHNCPKK